MKFGVHRFSFKKQGIGPKPMPCFTSVYSGLSAGIRISLHLGSRIISALSFLC